MRRVGDQVDQLAGAAVGAVQLGRGPALGGGERRRQRGLQLQLGGQALGLGQAVDQLKGPLQMGDGLVVGGAAQRQRAGQLPVLQGLGAQPGLAEVLGHQVGPRRRGFREQRNQGLGDLAVDLLPGGAQQRLVGRVLDQRVLEGIGRRRRGIGGIDQIELQQPAQHQLERGAAAARDLLQQLKAKLATNHRGQLGHRLVGAQPVDAGHQRVVHGVGDQPGRQRAVQLVAVVQLAQHAGLEDGARDRLDKQRHPTGALDQLAQHALGQRLGADHTFDQRPRIAHRQRWQIQLDQVGRRGPADGRLGPGGADDAQRRADLPRHQCGHQFQRRRVGPVQVFDQHQHRRAFGCVPQQLAQDLQRALAAARRRHVQRRVTLAGGDAEQLGQQRQGFVQQHAAAGGKALQGLQHFLGRARDLQPQPAAQHVGDGKQRAVHVVRRALQLEQLVQLAAGDLTRHAQQTRLADAGFTPHQQRAAGAGRHLGPGAGNQCHFVAPADEGHQARRGLGIEAADRIAAAQHTEDLQRPRDPLEGARSQFFQQEAARHQAPGGLADQQGVGRGLGLQTGGDIGRLAKCQLLAPLTAAHATDHHQAGVDADADLRALAQPRQAVLALQQLDAGLHGPHRVVLMRGGIAEIGQDAVAQVLGDVAVVAAHDVGAVLLVFGVELVQILRVHALGQAARPDQVTEEQGQLAALAIGQRVDATQ